MRHDEILASVSVLVLAGVIVYATKFGGVTVAKLLHKDATIAANQQNAAWAVNGAGGDPSALVNGPAIYVQNTPFPYWPPVGNVIPPTNAGTTLPGAANADFLGFFAG